MKKITPYLIGFLAVLVVAGLPSLGPEAGEAAAELWALPALLEHLPVAAGRRSPGLIRVQADETSTETIPNLPFDECRELMGKKIAELGANPMGVISVLNTSYVKIIRVCTEPGDVVFTCSKADQWLAIITNRISADKRCK